METLEEQVENVFACLDAARAERLAGNIAVAHDLEYIGGHGIDFPDGTQHGTFGACYDALLHAWELSLENVCATLPEAVDLLCEARLWDRQSEEGQAYYA